VCLTYWSNSPRRQDESPGEFAAYRSDSAARR
jgi:hypothetical protein